MSAPVLPSIALPALAAAGHRVEAVSRGRGPLHIAADPSFTGGGALRRGRRPVCGQPARRWYLAVVDERPLCLRCAAWTRRHVDLTARLALTVEQLREALLHATTPAQVSAVQMAALKACLTRELVDHPDRTFGRVPLHRLLHDTRARVSHPAFGQTARSWQQQIDADPTRYSTRRSA